ncbi:MAG: hypothetical protein HQL91_12270 [Magnetococcales bacterium]|nr:hypothetical protein [Magnetococcales bacterium]
MSQTQETEPSDSYQDTRIFDLDDPEDRKALAHHMEVAQDIPNGYGGLLIRAGEQITPKIYEAILRLHERGLLQTFRAQSMGSRFLASAASVQQLLHKMVENVVQETNHSISDIATIIKNNSDFQLFKQVIHRNFQETLKLFNPISIKRMKELQQHHPASGNHSVISGFNEMILCRDEKLPESEVLERVMAVMQHDIGKTKINLSTLTWPGALSQTQWREMQLHTLLGFELLREKDEITLPALTALLHHEWYALVPGKGYGGASNFRDYLRTELGVDMEQVLARMDKDTLATVHQCAIADMVAALEEVRSYKQRIGPFKVLVIMVSDAKQGHFCPEQFKRWYRTYRRDNIVLLPEGLCVALPREIERREYAKPVPIKLPIPQRMLTLPELEAIGMPANLLGWKDRERIRRQGGLPWKDIQQINEQKNLQLDLEARLREQGITLLKKNAVIEEQHIVLDVMLSWISYEELEQADLLFFARARNFSLDLIQNNHGILFENLVSRGGEQQVIRRLLQQQIEWHRHATIRLPAFEYRLSPADLDRLELTPLLAKIPFTPKKYGVRVDHLAQLGITMQDNHLLKLGLKPGLKIPYTPHLLSLLGFETESMIFFDMLVVEQIDLVSRAKVVFMREGDSWHELKKMRDDKLDPLQRYLVHKIGIVEMDFTATIALPNLDHVTLGDHWKPGSGYRPPAF